MTRATTTDQDAALASRFTKPIYLLEIEIDGQEYLSTNGDVTVGTQVYAGSSCAVRSIGNGENASIALRPTAERVAQFVSQSWRYGRCRISLLPGRNVLEYFEPDYVEDDYGEQGDVFAEPMVLLDGELTDGRMSANAVEFTVANRIAVGRWLPAVRIAPPICNHLPTIGRVVTWEGDRYTLESRT